MLTADQNFRLLQEIEENRRFLLMAYRQNPKLLENAETRIQQIVGMVTPPGRDNHQSSVLCVAVTAQAVGTARPAPCGCSPQSSERGISLVELIMFIVIISVALAGILTVMNRVTGHSADTLIRKQALAIAESLLEEVELMPFTYCDPDDANLETAANALGCATTQEVIGTEGAEGRYTPAVAPATMPFDNVSDYDGCRINGAANPGCDAAGNSGIMDINHSVVSTSLNGYSAAVTVTEVSLAGITLASKDALQITVTVNGPDNTSVVLDGYRARYAPNEGP